MAKSDDIDSLVSSVRNLVSDRDADAMPKPAGADRLVLTPALRVDVPARMVIPDMPATDAQDASADRQPSSVSPEDAASSHSNDYAPDDDEVFENPTWAAGTFQTSQKKSDDPVPSPVTDTAPAQDKDIAGLIDQAALRDMIVAVVQEELAGEMGERITHNVRKLVRREINRLIAAQELD